MKTCAKCGHTGALEDFHRDRSRPDGRFPYCKQCNTKHSRAWVERNHEQYKEYLRAYRDTHLEYLQEYGRAYSKARYQRLREEDPEIWRQYVRSRRAKKRGQTTNPPTPSEIRARIEHCGRVCVYCGGSYEAIDHVVAVSRGGGDDLPNLVPSCASCNGSKGTQDWVHWFRKQHFYSPEAESRIAFLIARST
ncbi:HNH endonuclease [Nitrolancea hollandica]|uniref:HNH nuclease domain-containing protein n=1 Tax=Nitrolancea hollandica Lb TaxID=1129897 RepID=I4EG12_9BACT|nr:hypothetical protein NITHO_2510022 [Nitrolancea hollandica Lb]